MKLLWAVCLNWLFASVESKILSHESMSKDSSNLANAIVEIVDNFYATSTADLMFSDASKSCRIKDFHDEILLRSFGSNKNEMSYEVSSKPTFSPRRKLFTILTIESFDDFLRLYKEITPTAFKFNGFFLIALVSREIPDVEAIFKLFWKLQIYNVNVMFEDENGEVLVKTFIPFNHRKCNDTTPVLIKKSKDGSLYGGSFYPDKMKNLHNCPVRVAILNYSEPSIFINYSPNGTMQTSGSDIDLITAIAKSLNFRINYKLIGYPAMRCESFNDSIPFKSSFGDNADLSVAYWLLRVDCFKTFDMTSSYISDRIIFFIPPGRDLSAFEILIYPFHYILWVIIACCIFAGFLVIFIVKRSSMFAQNIVFGTGVRDPYLNMFAGYIGVNQNILPKKNFARFILTMFLIYALVIRTVYQSSFYELLESSKQHKEVQTISEMVENDFKFYGQLGIAGLFQGSEQIWRRFIAVPSEQRLSYLEKIRTDPTFKGAFGRSLQKALYDLQTSPRNTWNLICNDVVMTVPVVIMTKKDFYLLDRINDKIELLKAAGLINFWHLQGIDIGKIRHKEKKPARKLSVPRLFGCFNILIFGCFVGFVAFLYELILAKLVKSREETYVVKT